LGVTVRFCDLFQPVSPLAELALVLEENDDLVCDFLVYFVDKYDFEAVVEGGRFLGTLLVARIFAALGCLGGVGLLVDDVLDSFYLLKPTQHLTLLSFLLQLVNQSFTLKI